MLLQAFLHRIVNSGGRIEREYGLGRGRTDLLIIWPRAGGTGAGGASGTPSSLAGGGEPRGGVVRADRIVIECKVLHGSLERTIADGLEQTAAYMDRCAAREGHLVIVDRSPGKEWNEKVFHRRTVSRGVTIDVWGM